MAVQAPPSHRGEQGFTLIELAVVLLVIAVLATLAIPNFLGFADRAHAAAARNDARTMARLLAMQGEEPRVTTMAQLVAAGFDRSPHLDHAICAGPEGPSHATAAMHLGSGRAWLVDFEGRLVEATASDLAEALTSLAGCPGPEAVDVLPAA